MEKASYWAEDPYWMDSLDAIERLATSGKRGLAIDLEAVKQIAYEESSPAFKLMEAMQSVAEQEGMEGYKGAPRLMLALLARLAELGDGEQALLGKPKLSGCAPAGDKEIIYILRNPAMPGLIKIGRTSQADVTLRMNQLYTTGVPVPFECVYAVEVDCIPNVEAALHTAFSPNRINPNREFFQIESEQAVAIMKVLGGTDVTPQINSELNANISQAEKESGKKIRRPRMDFYEMGMSAGDMLIYKDGETTVEVVDNRTVKLNDSTMSLTAATRELMGITHSVQPAPYWFFKEKLIKDLYEETYPFDEEG